MPYNYIVEYVNGKLRRKLYYGTDVTEAMAAFSKSVSDNDEYIMLEALRIEDKNNAV